MVTAYAIRKGNCVREHGCPFLEFQPAIDGTIGTIGVPLSVRQIVGPLYEGIDTTTTVGTS